MFVNILFNYINDFIIKQFRGVVKSSIPAAPIVVPFTTSLTGSNITYSNGIYVLTFRANGSMTFKTGVILPTLVNYVLVAGGGSGGVGITSGATYNGGGGGGGSVIKITGGINGNQLTEADLIKTITFVIGGGGGPPSGSYYAAGGTGGNTTMTIPGKGGYTSFGGIGAPGGSGGAGGYDGGGAGGTGGNSSSNNGNPGTAIIINGITYYFAGGGAAGYTQTLTNPTGGIGGGGGNTGNGGVNPYIGPNGFTRAQVSNYGYVNSGGGGGGSTALTNNTAGAGGSGTVIVWFTYP